jgi:carboxymethylenebutenolidase
MEIRNEIEDLLHLYEDGAFSRREIVERLTKTTGSLAGALALLAGFPDHATAQTPGAQEASDLRVAETDAAIDAKMVEFEGKGARLMAYLVRPKRAAGPQPAVLVIHENRGLNEHIKDVTRRVAKGGYIALGIDLLSRQGGTAKYSDPQALSAAFRDLQRAALLDDLQSSLDYLKKQDFVRGDRLGTVGFCFGGGNVSNLAVNTKDLAAAVTYYGTPLALEKLDDLACPWLGIYAELDARLTGAVGPVVAALVEKKKPFGLHIYPGTNHAFNNDTGPRFHRAAAVSAWAQTMAFFETNLRKA